MTLRTLVPNSIYRTVLCALAISVFTGNSSSGFEHETVDLGLPTFLKGPHLSGAEYNDGPPAKRYGTDYIYPTTRELDYYKSINFSVIRLSFDIYRVQPKNMAPLNKVELERIENLVQYALHIKMFVILDPHNYGAMYNSTASKVQVIGVESGVRNEVFADFWTKMTNEFKDYPNVIWGLMNEPFKQTPAEWKASAVAAVQAIRLAEGTGLKHLILIPGSCWTTVATWASCGNAAQWEGYRDPVDGPFMFEMHQYLDADFSGSHRTCSFNWVPGFLQTTEWLKRNNFKGYIGEFGWGAVNGVVSTQCQLAGLRFMNAIKSAENQWGGWVWCCSGPWAGDNGFNLLNLDFTPPRVGPQVTVLKNYTP